MNDSSHLVRLARLHEVRPHFSKSTWQRFIEADLLSTQKVGKRCVFVDLRDVDHLLANLPSESPRTLANAVKAAKAAAGSAA